MANPEEVKHEYNLITSQQISNDKFDTIVLGVAHKEFLNMEFTTFRKKLSILYDIKGVLYGDNVDGSL